MNKRIASLGALLFVGLAVGVSSLEARTLDREKYLTVSEVELYEVVDGRESFVERLPAPAPTEKPTEPKKDGGLGDIISIGEKIWQIIEANRPVVTQNYSAVSALPVGATVWTDLDGWSEPTIKIFKLVYTNTYKMKVVEFEYRVAYTTGGTFKGVGQYLSRVEIEPKVLNVAWGYKFNANGMVLSVTNAGTREAPLAAMELNLNWSVETVMRHMSQSVRYYIRGDGLFKSISDGNMATGLK